MDFLFPYVLFWLLLLPIYIWLCISFENKRKKDLVPFGNIEALKEVISKTRISSNLRFLPLVFQCIIYIFLVIALARPQANILVPSKNSQVMILFDNSISMEANDIKPNRLEAARDTAIDFVKDLPSGIKIGFGTFSGNVKILVNPTTKKEQTISALKSLSLNSLEPGTAIGDAIKAGTSALSYGSEPGIDKNNNAIILITDGEANVGTDPIYAASLAKNNGIVITSIGIGNSQGTIIRGGILTKLDEITLQQISAFTQGDYYNAQNLNDMNEIYSKIKTSIKLTTEKSEITYIAVLISFIFLFLLQILKWTKFRFS